jgi:hypothetical protein
MWSYLDVCTRAQEINPSEKKIFIHSTIFIKQQQQSETEERPGGPVGAMAPPPHLLEIIISPLAPARAGSIHFGALGEKFK